MSTLAASTTTTTTPSLAPAIEPANQPIFSQQLSYMNKTSGPSTTGPGGGSGDFGAISIAIAETTSATTAAADDDEQKSNSSSSHVNVGGMRILKKTMSTDSMLDDGKSNAGQSSSGGGTPSTKQRKYERKTKRFIWPDELHRLFVAAIFDVGLKNASPKALLGLMGAAGPDSGLTTEHLKSHLQKYRLNYERSRQEFLEFYDHSAKKNLKRRRKNGNKPGEHNTMFVFPISHKKQKGVDTGDSDDSDDSDDGEGGVEDTSMSDSTLEHTTPRGSGAGVGLLERAGSFTSMMQDPKDPISAAVYAHRSQQQLQNQMVSDRSSFGSNQSNGASSTQAMQAAVYAASQRKASLSSSGNNSSANVMNNRAMAAAAAAAAAAYRYPAGLPMGGAGGAGGPGNAGGQLSELSDPQWNILTSLMSPHISGMNGSAIPTSEGLNGEQFQLHNDEPNDLQMQMHLAMQAQMNLHRQMLTRKVEVSQHLINSQRDGNNSNNNGGNNNNNFGLAWGGNATATQHHHHQQQQQRQQQQSQQYYHPDQQQQHQQRAAVAAAAARQVLANSSHHPQMQMNLAANTTGVNQTPRPSLAPRPSNLASTISTSMSTSSSSSLGMGNTYAASVASGGGQRASNAVGQMIQPMDGVNALLHDNNSTDGTLGANLGFDKNSGGPVGAGGPSPAVDDDSLDLYRWDRIDLNVELDDDDLFGFLKS